MRRETVYRLLAAGVCAAWVTVAPYAPAQLLRPHPMPRLLFPGNYSVVESGKFDVMVVASPNADGTFEPLPLRVDGKELPWGPNKAPLYVAGVDLAPGEHTLSLGSCEVVFFVGGGAAGPKDWPVFKAHRVTEEWKTCGTCHDTVARDGTTELGPHKGYEVCAGCHNAADVKTKHKHPEAPLQDCASCHAVHGSNLEYLLKGPEKQLCAKCHRG